MTSNELFEIFITLSFIGSNNYLVGGCVRDRILGYNPNDHDIVTDIPIVNLVEVFKDNGWSIDRSSIKFLVLKISKNNKDFEIANFRKDSSTSDGRRPDHVEVGTIEEDALRRDFPINSLYYNPFTDETLDPTGKGLSDIENEIIRFNGDPETRILEDYLRIMRVYRFSSRLNFSIEKNVLRLCRKYFNDMYKMIPPDRIRNEIEKMTRLQ